MKSRKIRVGSRESKLAVVQARMVMQAIEAHHPEIETELVTMKTTGDIILDKALDKIGGKGLFIKELDKALTEDRIDISVHSLKDMPMEVSPELPLAAFSKRENPFDVLVLPEGCENADFSRPVGSSSKRRICQLKEIYPEAEAETVRGNVLTRLSKLDSGQYSALILAYAGLARLGLEDRISRSFLPDEMVPAAGQGILAVQGRQGDDLAFLDCINHREAEIAARTERAFVAWLDGGCSSPIGAYAEVAGEEIRIRGLYYDEAQDKVRKGEISGDVNASEELAVRLAKRLKEER